jgi:hypothetical protein
MYRKQVFFVISNSPVVVAFVGSLLLSLIAVLGVVTVGKDAAFYLDIARQTSEQGPGVALERFDWPWFVLLLAGTHKFLGLPLELAAYLWCGFFMAGACALLVDAVRQRAPMAVWWAVLVVLAMPAFNQFRADILREFGFWFFSVLALWLALRWQVSRSFLEATSLMLSIMAAALFRLEAMLLLPALALWQLPALGQSDQRRGALQMYLLLSGLAGLGMLGLLAAVRLFDFPIDRLTYYASLLNPKELLGAFNTLAEQFGDSLINKYSRDEAGYIVFFGLVAALLIKFLQLLGPFSVLLLDRCSWSRSIGAVRSFSLFGWAIFLYFLVLLFFFIQQQFVNSRYLSFLNLLAVPPVALLAAVCAERWVRLRGVFIFFVLLVMVANVVSLGAKKTHYVEAGTWVSKNLPPQAHIYYEDGRIAYYAGRGYIFSPSRQSVLDDPEQYDYLLIETDGDEGWVPEWLAQHDFRVIEEFSNRKNDTVLIVGE